MQTIREIFEEISEIKINEEKTYDSSDFIQTFFSSKVFKSENPKQTINLYCNECKKEQVFLSSISNVMSNVYFLENICLICKCWCLSFFIFINEKQNVFKIRKCGATIDLSLFKFNNKYLETLSKEELYNKSLIAYQNNLYTGAYVYFRKLLEQKIDNILKDLEITLDKGKNRFEDKISRLVKSDIFQNKTIFTGLYSNLSKAVHGLSEQECEQNFLLIKQIFEFAIEEIEIKHEREKKQKKIIDQLSNLNNPQFRNEVKDNK